MLNEFFNDATYISMRGIYRSAKLSEEKKLI